MRMLAPASGAYRTFFRLGNPAGAETFRVRRKRPGQGGGATIIMLHELSGCYIRRGRDQDFIAFLAACARTNPRLTRYQRQRDSATPGSVGVQTYESILEVDYGALIAQWLTPRPNLQYVIRPGGTGAIRNALVFGIYTRVTF